MFGVPQKQVAPPTATPQPEPRIEASAAWANACLGNNLSAIILEISLGANTLTFSESCVIAWAGAPHRVTRNGEVLPPRTPITINAGDIIEIAPGMWGNRIAIATVDGWQGRSDSGLSYSGAEAKAVTLPDHRGSLAWLPRRGYVRATVGPETPNDWQPSDFYRVTQEASNQGIRLHGPVPTLPAMILFLVR